MAPITSFIKIHPRYVVPVKTYVNRKEIQKNISELSLDQTTVNLSRVVRITLSNKDLRLLYEEIKLTLLPILMDYPMEHIRSISTTVSGGKMRVPISTDTWKCYLEITEAEIQELRQLLQFQDASGLVRSWLLVKDRVFKPQTEQLASFGLDQDDEEQDEKKTLRIKYRHPQILPLQQSLTVTGDQSQLLGVLSDGVKVVSKRGLQFLSGDVRKLGLGNERFSLSSDQFLFQDHNLWRLWVLVLEVSNLVSDFLFPVSGWLNRTLDVSDALEGNSILIVSVDELVIQFTNLVDQHTQFVGNVTDIVFVVSTPKRKLLSSRFSLLGRKLNGSHNVLLHLHQLSKFLGKVWTKRTSSGSSDGVGNRAFTKKSVGLRGGWRNRDWVLQVRSSWSSAGSEGILFGAGDALAQICFPHDSNYEYLRTARAITYGGLIFGPIGTRLYRLIDVIHFPFQWYPKKILDISTRVAFDQLVWAPVGIPLYYTCITIMEGYGVPEIKAKLNEVYWETLVNNWKVWPIFQAVNFWLVPVKHRLLAVNIVSILWNCYLSLENRLSNEKVETA